MFADGGCEGNRIKKKGCEKIHTPVTGLLSLVTGRRKAAGLRLPFIVCCWFGRVFGLSLPLQKKPRQATDEKKGAFLFLFGRTRQPRVLSIG
ncbi:hypothetical protein, partial [uncultured Acidaminococcus sp.]|uniref:hypothetical protein n=1 Tax=uncultured Acidaminococcus sp. TaxID=352152 RepID=UPI00294352D1